MSDDSNLVGRPGEMISAMNGQPVRKPDWLQGMADKQIRPYGAGFGQSVDFFKAAKV